MKPLVAMDSPVANRTVTEAAAAVPTLRPATEADGLFLAQLFAGTRADELAAVPWSRQEKAAFLRMQFDAQHQHYHRHYPDAEFNVIMLDDAPIGRLYVQEQADEIRLIDITLLPGYRNHGLGSHFMHALQTRARRTGKPIRIHVEQFNPARRLYERLGFRLLERRGLYDFMEWVSASEAPA